MTSNNNMTAQQIVFVALDDRPCCCQFVERLAAFRGIQLSVPPHDLLGGLTDRGKSGALLSWMQSQPAAAQYLLSLDMLAWGGLVGSRRPTESDATARPGLLPQLKALSERNALDERSSLCCFSTIMRVAPTQKTVAEVTEAERLVKFSCFLGERYESYRELESAVASAKVLPLGADGGFTIAEASWSDYWYQRSYKHEFHRQLIERWKEHPAGAYLLFGFDDSQTRGLNILEAAELHELAQGQNHIAFTTGADELAQLLLVRMVAPGQSIGVEWNHPVAAQIVTRYEDASLGEVLERQLAVTASKCDETSICRKRLFVWAPERYPQMESAHQSDDSGDAEMLTSFIERVRASLDTGCQVVIADVAYANGGCQRLVDMLLENKLWARLSGYAAWNTAGNTLGTALATLLMLPETLTPEQERSVRRFMWERFCDDYLYEAVIRQQLSQQVGGTFLVLDGAKCAECERIIQEQMAARLLELEVIPATEDVVVTLPWNRLFEARVEINNLC